LKKNKQKSYFLILNFFLILLLFYTTILYTSLFENSPFGYEPSGTQFFIIFILIDPMLLIIALFNYWLNKYIKINKMNLFIPLFSIFIISLPIIIDSSLSQITMVIGTILSSFISIFVVYLNIKFYTKNRNNL
jgi:hypothetical protein